MKKATIIKRSIGLLTSVAMLVFMSFPVCAAPAVSEDVVVSTESNGGGTVSPMYSSIPGFNAANISGGYGEVKVTIGKSISTAYFQAAVSPNNNSGTIRVSVKSPSGAYISLGGMLASGGSTNLKLVYGLSAGTYTFIFESSSFATFNVQGYIYE